MASSGLHSNGYSLVRHVLLERAGWSLERQVPEFGRSLGEELLEPTKIYSLDCLALTRTTEVHAFSHITGGGLAGNLARVVPDGLHARRRPRHLDTRHRSSTWSARLGDVERAELEKTLNMGVGMVAVVPQESVDAALTTLTDRGVDAWVAGKISERGTRPGRDPDGRAPGVTAAAGRRRRGRGQHETRSGGCRTGPVQLRRRAAATSSLCQAWRPFTSDSDDSSSSSSSVYTVRVLCVRVVLRLIVLERLAIRRLVRRRCAQLLGQT